MDLKWVTFINVNIQRKENTHRDTLYISAKIKLGLSGGKHNKYLSILTLRGRDHIASHKKAGGNINAQVVEKNLSSYLALSIETPR